jgi:ABC-type lipoprotein release transport system permease subunit
MSDTTHGLGLTAYLSMGARNLRLHLRRTLLTVLSLAAGVGALVFLGALADGWLRGMQDNFVMSLVGHLQVHAPGFRDSMQLTDRIRDPGPVMAAVARDPQVAAWATRVEVSGLAAAGGRNAGVHVMAMDPAREPEVTWLGACLVEGEPLEKGRRGVLMGHALAENLEAMVGDRVVLTAQTPGGAMASEVFTLQGVLCPAGPETDRWLAVILLGCAQRWLGLGDAITEVVVRAESYAAVPALAQRLDAALADGAYQVLRWDQADPMVDQWLDFAGAYSAFLILIVVALVLAQVLNTQLMAVYQRGPELALMEAVGTRPRQVFALILVEGLLLVLTGVLLGYLAGILAVALVAERGLDLSAFAGALSVFHMSPVVHPELTAASAARVLGSTLAGALLGTVYPAWRAARRGGARGMQRLG